ncbi:MAG: right-handed parallel beta-helix repeat-containing protein [Rhizomicrobium sp.]
MFKYSKLAGMFAAALMALMWVAPAQAQATRTWVSGVGDDVNPCSRTAPCKTFAGAISKTAVGGEIDVLDPGGFGALTITKSITIDGSGGSIAGILVGGTPGFTVNAAGAVVTIRNIDFEGVGFSPTTPGTIGIRFVAGAVLHVEHCVIRNFRDPTNGAGIAFAPNSAAQLYVDDTILSGNGSGTGNAAVGGGIVMKPTSGGSVLASLWHVRIEGNSNGISLDTSTSGAMASSAVIVDSVISGGAVAAAAVAAGSVQTVLTINHSIVQGGTIYGVFAGGASAQAVVGTSIVTGNATAMFPTGGGLTVSYGDNEIGGNTSAGTISATILKS